MSESLFEGAVAGLAYRIVRSNRSGVPKGHHLIISLVDQSVEPSPAQHGELLAALVGHAEKHYSGVPYRVELNSPALRGGKSRGWHAHLKVLGEGDELPRCVEAFSRDGDNLVVRSPR